MLKNHAVRFTEKKSWPGFWTEISIEQILMKSQKRQQNIIGKEMTDNVLVV